MPTYNGTSGNDTLTGGGLDDIVNAGEGNNVIDAGYGNNTVNAGSGNDSVIAGSGNDVINAGEGANRIHAGNGNNRVNSGSGADTIVSGTGDDQLNIGGGANLVQDDGGYNTINASGGADTIMTGAGNDSINAGDGNNLIRAGDGANRINTGSGADDIVTGTGNDIVYSGEGADIVGVGGGNDLVYLGGGNDTIRHVISENSGAKDDYWGESGTDTLQLVFTAEQARNTAILADLNAFQASMAKGEWMYTFKSMGLVARQFEKLDLVAPVEANDDTVNLGEDDAPITFSVLGNDVDLLATGNAALTVTGFDASGLPAGATLKLNPNGTFSFDPGTAFQSLNSGEKAVFTFTYTLSDNQGFSDTAEVSVTINGSDDKLVLNDVTFTQASAATDPDTRFEPSVDSDGQITSLLAKHGVAGIFDWLEVNGNRADTFKVLWDFVDDNYSYYDTGINAIAIRLAVEYARYVQGGGDPLRDVVVKASDAGRSQSLHDNLLGNLHIPSIQDKLLGGAQGGSNPNPDPDLYNELIALISANDLFGRPYYGGNPGEAKAPAKQWDVSHGMDLPNDAPTGDVAVVRSPSHDTSSRPLEASDITDPSNQVFNPANHHIYEWVGSAMPWSAARDAALTKTVAGIQGHLVTLTSASEHQFVYESFQSKFAFTESVPWIGLTDAAREGAWTWASGPEAGQPATYLNWASGEPNDVAHPPDGEDFAVLHWQRGPGNWFDYPASFSQPSIIEYSGQATASTPRVTLTADASRVADQDGIGEFRFQWQSEVGGVWFDIAGASSSSYEIGQDVNGGTFRPVISYTDGTGHHEQVLGQAYRHAPHPSNNAPTGALTVASSVSYETTSVALKASDVTDPSTQFFNPANQHIYEWVETATSWADARDAALLKSVAGVQGHLVTLTDGSENQLVYDSVRSRYEGTESVPWIGASDAAQEGDWRWAAGPEAGQPLSFTNWGGGEPNDVPAGPDGEDYAVLHWGGRWLDYPTFFLQPSIVEYSGSAQTSKARTSLIAGTSQIADPDGLGEFHFQWQSQAGGAWSNMTAETSALFKIGADVTSGSFRPVVTYTDGLGHAETVVGQAYVYGTDAVI